jgi:hypothetical protein
VRASITREFLRYAAAVLGYIVIGYFDKRWVAFTWGPLYFIAVLEVLPRTYRRIRNPRGPRPKLGPIEIPLESATELSEP